MLRLRLGLVGGLLVALLAFASGCAPGLGGAGGSTGGFDASIVIFVVIIFGLFWFRMMYPQRRGQKEHTAMRLGLKKGDRVSTSGGIYGQIDAVGEDSIVLKMEAGGTIRVARNSVVGRQEKV